MTKVLRKTKEEKEQHMIESAWKTLEDVQGYREKADFQRTFERWWKGVARSSHSVKASYLSYLLYFSVNLSSNFN